MAQQQEVLACDKLASQYHLKRGEIVLCIERASDGAMHRLCCTYAAQAVRNNLPMIVDLNSYGARGLESVVPMLCQTVGRERYVIGDTLSVRARRNLQEFDDVLLCEICPAVT